ncbi:hypothetical protein NCS52_00329500 [Fusarium sp. LHS14.1]|nr:hypothetical protein NCS52_00329500 [Fusarium sp. LHS14.1]
MNNREPDLCVGIDFGTTYTGVSWSTPKEISNRINIIKQWPGEAIDEEKVPTVLAKDASGGETRWGFLCKELAEHKKWRYFKLLLKADLTFSRQLRLKTWDSLAIDFVFSTPTTWQAPVSLCFRGIVSKAGFGEQKAHRVVLGLTEAEASAVFTCQPWTVGKVQKDDVVLSIGAGGGTTDLAFVKATDDTAGSLTLEEIRPVTGVTTGSITIDTEFEKIIDKRVEQHSETRRELPKDFSLKVSQSHDFQTWKHKLGPKDRAPSGGEYRIRRVTGKDSYSHEGLGIREDSLYFTRRQLESCFDIALQEIKGLVKDALGNFEANNHHKRTARHVNYIVLSGGLGSSDYVLNELTAYFNRLGNEANSCVTGSKVFRAEGDARTAVVKGLLHDRRTKARTLGEHKARSNYGIIVEEPQSASRSPNESTKRYPKDTTVFVTDRIHWLVKFGETIQVDKPTTVKITKRLEKSDEWKWTEKIVWLGGGGENLPTNVKDGCKMRMEELRSVDIEVRPGVKLSAGARTVLGKRAYHECEFNLMLVVGPSGDCDVEVSENVIKRSE